MMFKKKCVWKSCQITLDGFRLTKIFYPDCVPIRIINANKKEIKKKYKVCPYCLRKIKIK